MARKNDSKHSIRFFKVCILILNALLFTFTTTFTFVAIWSTWGHTNLSYVVFWLFFIDIVLFLLRYIFSGMRKRPEGVYTLLYGINIIRSVLKIVYVLFALILAFVTYDNNDISSIARTIMMWFSVCMVITYVLLKTSLFIVRKSTGSRRERYVRTFKIKNKRSR